MRRPRPIRSGRWVGIVFLAAALALLAIAAGSASAAPLTTCPSSSLYVVAHADDSLLFQAPALQGDFSSGDCVRSVFVTAGDAGEERSYWGTREVGVEAAYSRMAGVADEWTESRLEAAGHSLVLETLNGAPNISVVFMRLPDGNPGGEGTELFGRQSLRQLWNGGNPGSVGVSPTISSMTTVDGAETYTYEGLIETLASVIETSEPRLIATQNFEGYFGDGDHTDHVATAFFTQLAQGSYSAPHQLVGYEGYEDAERPQNVFGEELKAKSATFYAYGEVDSHACPNEPECEATEYSSWLKREYVAGEETTGIVAVPGYAQSVASGAAVTLDGSGSSSESGRALTYRWAQTAGPAVALSSSTAARPTFTAPTGPATLGFSLVVSDGSRTSTASTVTVTVAAPAVVEQKAVNVAPLATATASSQASGQEARKAIDGVISGYPAKPEAEWASSSGRVGTTLTLKWAASQTLEKVVLYDRPNTDDQITSGKLTFSDGQSVTFGALPNAGTTGLAVTFPAHATTSLVMTVTGVGTTTKNVGLSEIEAFGVEGPAGGSPENVAPTITSAATGSFTSGTPGSVTISATGTPTPTLTETGALPSGLSFKAGGGGAATISGTAAAVGAPGSSATYPLTITATDAAGSVEQQLVLTVVNGEPVVEEKAPVASAGPAQSVASGAAVTLDGSGSSSESGRAPTYRWAQTAGPAVTLSSSTAARPTFTAPTGPATLGFSLVVSDGSRTSTASTVTVTVAAPAVVEQKAVNVAPLATASASSQASGQEARKAIDGVISGYPAKPEAEWASSSGRVGTTLTLKWAASQTLEKVVLYDRPNTDDQITSGKLTFSDGQSVTFGALPNAGTTGLAVTFPAHATTSLVMTVTGVGTTTKNVGLSEIEAFGVEGPAGGSPENVAPTITSAATGSFTSGTPGSVTISATGTPTPTLTETGALPSGLSFKAGGGGAATISGTAAAVGAPGSSATYPLTITATDAAGSVEQQLVLTVVNGEPVVEEKAPVASAGPAQSVASGAAVTLDGSGSSSESGRAPTYRWAQTAGPAVTLSSSTAARPTFTAPTGPATLGFSLVVSDGSRTSTASTVTVTVAAPAVVEQKAVNVAPLATASASSQASGQEARKAIDGVISGYPAKPEAEWASSSGRVGTTLTLKWAASQTLEKVVLYDRPNTDDQITSGKLTFSDGQSVTFGALPNAGTTGLAVTFPAHATTSLVMTVTGVGTTTKNVGLSEIEAFGVAGN